MLKRKFSKLGELGSMMVEALAMLGLISMVTPIVYKKAAERNLELQDVNAASQMRNLIKAVDEYIQDNYGRITDEDVVTNNCLIDSMDYKDFEDSTTGQFIEIPVAHLCEYLPYGFLDPDAQTPETAVLDNKIFNSDYRVVVKKVETDDHGKKTLTGFLVANPHLGADFPKIRASRIAAMIGGNGGYVDNNVALGTQGLWGINDLDSDLGLADVENGAIITSSVQPISSASGGSNDDAVLYRLRQPSNPHLNRMETTLYMGEDSANAQNIENINQAVITAARSGIMVDGNASKALWVRNAGGAFIDGVLNVAANNTDNPAFSVGMDGSVKAAGDAGAYKFEVDSTGAVKAADGKFQVGADGSIKAAGDTGDNFTVDAEGNIVSKGSIGVEKDMIAKGIGVIGSIGGTGQEEDFTLTVNGSAFIRGLLKVGQFKADLIDAGTLRAGTSDVASDDPNDYTLLVNDQRLRVGKDGNERFTINANTGDTEILGGDFIVSNHDASHDIFVVDNQSEYTIARGLRVGEGGTEGYSFEVTNDGAKDINLRLLNGNSEFIGYDANDNVMLEFTNDTSRIQKVASGDVFTSGTFRDDYAEILASSSADNRSSIEVFGRNISLDVTPGDDIPNIRVERADSTNYANVDFQRNNYIRAYGEHDAPVLMIDTEASFKDNSQDRTNAAESKGGVYIRRGVIDLQSDREADYLAPKFVEGKDMGYIRADMLFSHNLANSLDTNNHFFSSGDIPDVNQYDSFMVNPAFTSVMHDIKLTTRGGARLSDILPDFINKGIYLADNTFQESIGDWTNITYEITGGKVVGNVESTRACSGTDIYGCATSPWLGVVPTPQCPPGYDKVIQVVPYSFNIAQAGYPNQERDGLFYFTDPRTQEPHNDATRDQPFPLLFQKNTWLRTRATQIGERENLLGWYVLMGYVYPTSEWSNIWSSPNIVTDTNNYIWNLFPVYYRELEAYSTVFCHFSRKDRLGVAKFDANYVDVDYDQFNNFRRPLDKSSATNRNRLDDPNMDYKNPW